MGTPEIATRAYSDGQTATVLQYAVYDAAGNELTDLTVTDAEIHGSTTVNLQLTTGNTYSVIFWAAAPNAPYTVDFAAKTMEVDYTNATSNDEARDAFFHIKNEFVAGKNERFTLTRPFAQLNVGQSMEDYDAMQLTNNFIEKSSVTAEAYTTMSLIDASVSNLVDVELTVNNVLTDNLEVNSVGYKHIAMNYLLVNAKEVVNEVAFVVFISL